MIELLQGVSVAVKTYSGEFATYSKEYPIIAGSISLWALGLLASLRSYPQALWGVIKKQSTTTVTVTSSQDIFHLFSLWCEKNDFSSRSRSVKLNNGRYGEDDLVKSIGYGTHIFWYRFRPVKIEVTQSETHSQRERDELTMTTVGRNHAFFDGIISEASQIEEDSSLVVKRYKPDYWETVGSQRHRGMHTVYTERCVKDKLITHLDAFKKDKQWYIDKCLPYQTGVLLSGPPGTGKTSLIKAIASEYQYELHILNASRLYMIEEAFSSLPKKCIVVIEDIDSDPVTHKRDESDPTVVGAKSSVSSSEKEFTFSSISDVLNTIDGIIEGDDRILIMTTNHLEKIDKALLRPGRVDLMLEIGYATEDIFRQFFDSFYEGCPVDDSFVIKDGVSPACIQRTILSNLDNPEKVVEQMRVDPSRLTEAK